MSHSCIDFRSSFNVFLSVLTLQQCSPICFALWKRLHTLPSLCAAVCHTNADQTSPSVRMAKERRCAARKQNLLFVFLYLSRSLRVAFIQPSNQHSDHQLYRGSLWLSPVLGAWKQRLTQWLSWWQRVSQGCGNTVMIKLLWMVQQSTQRHSGPVKEERSALLCMQNRL